MLEAGLVQNFLLVPFKILGQKMVIQPYSNKNPTKQVLTSEKLRPGPIEVQADLLCSPGGSFHSLRGALIFFDATFG